MARFFVSYSRSVKEEVQKVVDLLRASGHEVWWDGDIPIMADWWATILNKIEWCQVFIFVASKKSVKSPYCIAELKYASDRNRPILPFMLDDSKQLQLPAVLPRRNQWLTYDGNPAHMLQQINDACQHISPELHRDITAPRPPEPNTGGKSIPARYQEARRLASEQQYEKAKQLLREIRKIDYGEWGAECDEWLARLNAYPVLVDLAEDQATRERAYQEWQVYVSKFGRDFDPANVEERLHTDKFDESDSSGHHTLQQSENTKASFLSASAGTVMFLLLLALIALLLILLFDLSTTETIVALTVYGVTLLAWLIGPEQLRKITLQQLRRPRILVGLIVLNVIILISIAMIIFPASGSDESAPSASLQRALERATGKITTNTRWQEWYPDGFIQEVDGVEMVLVPAGCLPMTGVSESDNNEQPASDRCFDEPFWIDRYEVSQAQFATSGGDAEQQSHFTGDNLPRENITWYEAQNFCKLREARLPTASEWVYAASGPDNWVYPWENNWDVSRVNTGLNYDDYANTAPVSEFESGKSWTGARQMAGNVWEWGGLTQDNSTLHGGSWYDFSDAVFRVDNYVSESPQFRNPGAGFRCVRANLSG